MDASRLLAQHARASLLLGADAVPISRARRGALDSSAVEVKPRSTDDTPSDAPSNDRPGGLGDDPETSSESAPETGPHDRPEPRAAPATTSKRPGSIESEPSMTSAEALAHIRARYEADAPHDQFNTSFTNIVFGEGDPDADLMFVGEAPGADEDATGRPFVGRAGQLLEKMIKAMGLTRESVYIANVLKTRPPNNATPTIEEASLCAPYLFAQIGVIRPKAIVTLGLPASRLLLESRESMGRLRGRWHGFVVPELPEGLAPPAAVGFECRVMPTYHPAFLLRSYTEENRAKVWSDLQQAMEVLGLKKP